MTLSTLDILAFDLYKEGLKAAKKKYVRLYEENYKEVANEAYQEAEYFFLRAKKNNVIPEDYLNGH